MKYNVFWYFIGLGIILIVILTVYIRKFLKSPTEQQIKMVKAALLTFVVQAEKIYKSGTGQLKLNYCYNLFIEKFPAIAPLVSYELFALWVDDALDQMKHLLETNLDIKAYVEGDE